MDKQSEQSEQSEQSKQLDIIITKISNSIIVSHKEHEKFFKNMNRILDVFFMIVLIFLITYFIVLIII